MAVRRTDLASLIQSRAFGGFSGPGSWRSSCLGCGLPRSTPEVLSRAPGAEITPVQKTHTAQPMALENFRNRCVLWMSILILFPLWPSSALFFSVLRPVPTSSSLLVLLLFLLLFRNYVEGGGERGSELSEGGREREKGEEGELLRSYAGSSLVHSERSDTLC